MRIDRLTIKNFRGFVAKLGNYRSSQLPILTTSKEEVGFRPLALSRSLPMKKGPALTHGAQLLFAGRVSGRRRCQRFPNIQLNPAVKLVC